MVMELKLGDVLQLRKVHPCGSYQWEVYRLGADIGIRCLGCGRRVLMARRVLERRTKKRVPREEEASGLGNDFPRKNPK